MGFDLGTSGARVSVIQTTDLQEVFTNAISWNDDWPYDDPKAWMQAIDTLMQKTADSLSLASVQSICFSGTSASCLLVDAANAGEPSRKACMYNYNVVSSTANEGRRGMALLEQYAPPRHTALSATGSLAKLLAWNEEKPVTKSERLCHQADYIALQFYNNERGESENHLAVSSDWHNCLKLGYDVQELQWPGWMKNLLGATGISLSVLPSQIVSPGAIMGTVSRDTAHKYGLSESCAIVGGTTDSNAAFFAATGSEPPMGTAVTSLGSTLAIKQLSSSYIEDASLGVYSHRFPLPLLDDPRKVAWLAGGASNVGCAMLRQLEFSNDELVQLSQGINPHDESPLQYYPLVGKGERFPVADASKEAILKPRPENRQEFLHGVLQGISDVERDGFITLGQLGATPSRPVLVNTSGGGACNDMWIELRQHRLRQAFGDSTIQVQRAENTEASYGAAILAAASFR